MKTRTSTIPLLLAVAGLLTAGTALAKQRPDPNDWHMGPPGAEQQLARLHEELQLTDQQSLQMLEVLQAAQQEREMLQARFLEQMQPEICALMQDTEADILALLTPEQAEQFQLLKAEREERFKEQRRSGGPRLDCPLNDG